MSAVEKGMAAQTVKRGINVPPEVSTAGHLALRDWIVNLLCRQSAQVVAENCDFA
jgi:hypothetical protein